MKRIDSNHISITNKEARALINALADGGLYCDKYASELLDCMVTREEKAEYVTPVTKTMKRLNNLESRLEEVL